MSKKFNDWLIDDDFLTNAGLSPSELEKFKTTSKRLYTCIASLPSPVYSSWSRNDKMFYFSIGRNYLKLPFDPSINAYDTGELLNQWGYKFYPGFSVETEDEREYTPEEIAEMIQQGEDPDEVFNKKLIFKKIKNFKIEKVVIRDDQLTINIDGKKFILITRPNMPLSKFISVFRKLKSDLEKKEFLEKYTKSILEVTFYKSIDIKYTGEELINFFRCRVPSLCDEPLKQVDENVYKWHRFVIHFSNEDQLTKAKQIIKNYKNEYKSIKNIDSYLRKEFNAIIGRKEDK